MPVKTLAYEKSIFPAKFGTKFQRYNLFIRKQRKISIRLDKIFKK